MVGTAVLKADLVGSWQREEEEDTDIRQGSLLTASGTAPSPTHHLASEVASPVSSLQAALPSPPSVCILQGSFLSLLLFSV